MMMRRVRFCLLMILVLWFMMIWWWRWWWWWGGLCCWPNFCRLLGTRQGLHWSYPPPQSDTCTLLIHTIIIITIIIIRIISMITIIVMAWNGEWIWSSMSIMVIWWIWRWLNEDDDNHDDDDENKDNVIFILFETWRSVALLAPSGALYDMMHIALL